MDQTSRTYGDKLGAALENKNREPPTVWCLTLVKGQPPVFDRQPMPAGMRGCVMVTGCGDSFKLYSALHFKEDAQEELGYLGRRMGLL